MAKIPFNIKFKPQIESGEYKVETRNGKPTRIICWDRKYGYPICCLVYEKATGCENYVNAYENGMAAINGIQEMNYDLFIITPDPELSEFEKGYMRIAHKMKPEDFNDEGLKIAKEEAAELLELAKDEIYSHESLVEYAKTAKAEGKANALRTHAAKLTENLVKSGLDKDSIPYHLIEFMCNLYTCQNWKEVEETAEAYVTRIKAAAMKDLPRWKKAKENIELGSDDFCFTLDNDGKMAPYWATEVEKGQYYITESDIENLPKKD